MSTSVKLVPKRRFKEFKNADAWEQRKLLESVDKIIDFRGRTPKKLGMDWSETGYLALSALNVKNGFIEADTDAHYGDQVLYDTWMSGNELHQGQVLFTTEAPMGNVAQVPDNKCYILSQRTIAFEVKKELITENYLAVVLGSPRSFSTLTALCSGGTAKGVSQKSLSGFYISVPRELKEQEELAKLFTSLDSLIALHQRKLEKLKSLKSAYLSDMFPAEGETVPKRRFKGFSDAWEHRKLLESVDKIIDFRGRTPKKLGMDWSEIGYLALSALNVKNGFIEADADAHYGDQVLYDTWMSGNELHQGQVLFTTEAPMGNVAQVPDNKCYILSQRTIAFEVKKELITENYLAVVLGSPRSFSTLTALCSGGTAKGVSQKSLSGFYISVPRELKEQEELAKLFNSLDNLITLHQRKLHKLQDTKKALLNEMFI